MWGFGPMVWRGDDGPLGGAGGAGRRDDGKVKGAWKAVPKLMEREVDDDLETEGEKGDWILEECLVSLSLSNLARGKHLLGDLWKKFQA